MTGAWAAWLVANALGRLPEGEATVDVESITPEALLAAARNQDGFGAIMATLHLRNSKEKVPGYSAIATIERPITLWQAPNLDLQKVAKPIPLIEVARDQKLIDGAAVQDIENMSASVRGVRFAGTVAGAIQLALNGQGILVAPQAVLDPALSLRPAPIPWKGGKALFDLMIDERAPVVSLVPQLIAALK